MIRVHALSPRPYDHCTILTTTTAEALGVLAELCPKLYLMQCAIPRTRETFTQHSSAQPPNHYFIIICVFIALPPPLRSTPVVEGVYRTWEKGRRPGQWCVS